MENRDGTANEEQYVNTRYVQDRLMVSRTKAYEIVKEIEEYAPEAVFRLGRCLRVRKDAFLRYIEERGDKEKILEPMTSRRRRVGRWTWSSEVENSIFRCSVNP